MKKLLSFLILSTILFSCTKEQLKEPDSDCKPVIQWLDTYGKDNVWLFTDTCKYYGVLCGEELKGFTEATKIQPGLCDNEYNRYVRIEIGGGNKEKHFIFK